MSDRQIDLIGKGYSAGNMSVADLALAAALTRLQVNWAIDEYRRRARK